MSDIEHLSIRFHDKIIFENASFQASKGNLTVIQGRSGIGKSTFLKALAFHYPCVYKYNDVSLFDMSDDVKQSFIYEKLGVVEQVPMFLEGMKVIEHIQQFESIGYKRNNEIENSLDIHAMESKLPRNLSGGERVRVALYLAMMKQPEVLILDEPTASLDVAYSKVVIELLKEYAHHGHIVIVASNDKKVIESGDVVYSIQNNKLISNHKIEENKKSPLHITTQNKSYKKFRIHHGYKGFRIAMLCLISLTLITLIYSSHIYTMFNENYQKQLDHLSSLELLVYKEKYNGDSTYSFEGSEFPFAETEIQQIKKIDHISKIDMHIDIEPLYGLSWGNCYDGANLNNLYILSLYDENKKLIKDFDMEWYAINSYDEDIDYNDKLSIKYQNNGIIISNSLYKTLMKQSPKTKLENPYLSFYLPIPTYNATNIVHEVISLNDKKSEQPVNCVISNVRKVQIPIKGVLKEKESLYFRELGVKDIFIPNNLYKQYIIENYPDKEKVVIEVDTGDNSKVFSDKVPIQYKDTEIIYQGIFAPWMPNSLSIQVDNASNITNVISNIEKLGFKVVSVYTDSQALSILNEDNQSILLSFFISVVINKQPRGRAHKCPPDICNGVFEILCDYNFNSNCS